MYLPTVFFLTTLISGLLFFTPRLHTYLVHSRLFFAFGGSYLFGIVLVHMLPDLFQRTYGTGIAIGNYLLIGFLLQLFFDHLGGSVVHGHMSSRIKKKNLPSHARTTLLGTLLLHAFLEGFALVGVPSHVWIAILLHKLPASFILMLALYHPRQSKIKLLLTLLVFAAGTPLGIIVSQHSGILTVTNLTKLTAIAIGGFFHIATTMLFESNPDHKPSISDWFAMLAGSGCTLFSHTHPIH